MFNWKQSLIMAIGCMIFTIFSGDMSGLLFFAGWYYISLEQFSEEKSNANVV